MDAVSELVKKLKEQVVASRRDLHRIPETGFNEAKTVRVRGRMPEKPRS